LSDPAGKGYLNKQGFFVALKLVALAQAGKALNLANMSSETAPPKIVKKNLEIHDNPINNCFFSIRGSCQMCCLVGLPSLPQWEEQTGQYNLLRK
jgi:hypothetical protein